MDAPEPIFDPTLDPSEESWEDALEALAEAPGWDEPDVESADPLGDLIASIDAAIAAGAAAPALDHKPSLEQARQGHIVFSLDGTRFTAPLDRVARLDRVGTLTPVPNTPAFVLGVANVRGEIVPALDLRRLLGLPGSPRPQDGRLMQLKTQSREVFAAVLVDALHGIRISESAEDQALDVDALLASDEIRGLMAAG